MFEKEKKMWQVCLSKEGKAETVDGEGKRKLRMYLEVQGDWQCKNISSGRLHTL